MKKPKPISEWMNISELAERMGVSRFTALALGLCNTCNTCNTIAV